MKRINYLTLLICGFMLYSFIVNAQNCPSPFVEVEVCSNQTDISLCECTSGSGGTFYYIPNGSSSDCSQYGCYSSLPADPADESDEALLNHTCNAAEYLANQKTPAACNNGCIDRGIFSRKEKTSETISGYDQSTGEPLFHVCCKATKTRVCAEVQKPTIFYDGPEGEETPGEKDSKEKEKEKKDEPGTKPPLFRPGSDEIG